MKYLLYSWNVNGVRAVAKKGFFDWLNITNADIVAIQETKADISQLDFTFTHPTGYESAWSSSSIRKGYSGTAVFSKIKPKNTIIGFDSAKFDGDGRVIIQDYDTFVLFNIYFPNGGRGPEWVKYKLEFYDLFLTKVQQYQKAHRSIIVCGDVNTAFAEIDLSRPKENISHSGFMPIERAGLQKFFDVGLIDTFRYLHPEKAQYTWWDMKTRARERDVGWRIDYFFISEDLRKSLVSAQIHNDIFGSDHCPISITIDI